MKTLIRIAALCAVSHGTAIAQNAVEREADAETQAPADILVTGRAEKLYRVEETSVGKLPTAPLASSQSVSIITDDLIRDQGARDAQALYRNISGVSVFSYAGVTARGFHQEENFYDGLRGDPYRGYAVPQLFNIERVEFLKGPAGMLYGQTAPGGLFNYVTKKPEWTSHGEVRVIGGTRSRYGASAEYTGPVAERVAVRAAGFYEDRNLERVNTDSRVVMLDGGVDLDLGFGKLAFQGFRYDIDLGGARLRGVPVTDGGDFLADRRWNAAEADDFLALRSNVGQVRFDGQLTPSLRVDVTTRYIDATERQAYHDTRALFDADADRIPDGVTREFRRQRRNNESWSFGTNAIWSRDIASGVSNRVLVGADHYFNTLTTDDARSRGTTATRPDLPSPITFRNPVHGITDPSRYTFGVNRVGEIGTTRRTGFYAMDEVTIGRLILIGGVRRDDFRDESGATAASGGDWTYRAGAVYRARPDISFFGQYATSFEPQGIASQDRRAGGPFDPTRGDIVETGIKTALMNGRIQSSIAAYRIRRTNILQPDPRGDVAGDGLDDFVAFGEVTSRGVDVDLSTDITPDWVLTLAYAYNDIEVTRSNGGNTISTSLSNGIGDRFPNAPRHKLGFWNRYQIPDAGLAFSLGGDYVSERVSLFNQRVKPYMVFDASVTWQRGPFHALLRVDNLLDKTYAASGFQLANGHFPGNPRSAFAELSYRF